MREFDVEEVIFEGGSLWFDNAGIGDSDSVDGLIVVCQDAPRASVIWTMYSP